MFRQAAASPGGCGQHPALPASSASEANITDTRAAPAAGAPSHGYNPRGHPRTCVSATCFRPATRSSKPHGRSPSGLRLSVLPGTQLRGASKRRARGFRFPRSPHLHRLRSAPNATVPSFRNRTWERPQPMKSRIMGLRYCRHLPELIALDYLDPRPGGTPEMVRDCLA
jgi:hypothetical protein